MSLGEPPGASDGRFRSHGEHGCPAEEEDNGQRHPSGR